MLDRTEAKIVSLFGLFFGTLFFGLSPIKVKQVLLSWRSPQDRENAVRRSRWGDTILSWLLCFGGGVLFATCFIHMIPEVREGFQDAEMNDSFPWTELIISCGFFLIYVVEEVVHWALCLHSGHAHHASETRTIRSCAANPYEPQRRPHQPPACDHAHGHSHRARSDPVVPKFSLERSLELAKNDVSCSDTTRTCAISGKPLTTWGPVSNNSTLGDTSWPVDEEPTASLVSNSIETASEPLAFSVKNYGATGVTVQPVEDQESVVKVVQFSPETIVVPASVQSLVPASPSPRPASPPCCEVHGHAAQISWSLVHEHSIHPMRSVFIILALSFHSLFEGLAIGLQKTAVDVWYLFAAVSFHKFVITFCVGLELAVGGVSRVMTILYILVFALVSPVGVGIGIGLSEVSSGDAQVETLTTTILSGIAAGTLLYVTFFEVLQREREREGNGVFRVFFVVAGYAAMVAFELFNGHDHGH